MGILIDVVEPGAPISTEQALRLTGPSKPPPSSKAKSALGGIAALLLLGLAAQLLLIGPGSQSTDQFLANQSLAGTSPLDNPDQMATRSAAPGDWAGNSRLLVIDESGSDEPTSLLEIDLLTGAETSWLPPEPMASSGLIALENYVVVLGEGGAWAGDMATSPEPTWTWLGPANRILNSTKPNHTWLRTNADNSAPTNARYLWTEVDSSGTVMRSHFRQSTLELETPEIMVGPGPGIFALNPIPTGSDDVWSVMSERGIVIAAGSTDLVASECGSFLECERTWYDPASGQARTGLYADLVRNIDTRFGAILSPGGRYVASEISDSQVKISTVASDREIANACQWELPIRWSADGDLLACATSEGVAVYFTPSGELLVLFDSPDSDWSDFVVIN